MKKTVDKVWHTIRERAIAGAVWFMLSAGGLFLWQRGASIWHAPEDYKRLLEYHKQDSLEHIKENHIQDSLNKLYRKWLDDDYLNIDSCKKEIKKHIR